MAKIGKAQGFFIEIKGYRTATRNAVEFDDAVVKGVASATRSVVEHWNTEAKKIAPRASGFLVSRMKAFDVVMSDYVAESGVGAPGVPYLIAVHEGDGKGRKFYEIPMNQYASTEWVKRYHRWIHLRVRKLAARVRRAT